MAVAAPELVADELGRVGGRIAKNLLAEPDHVSKFAERNGAIGGRNERGGVGGRVGRQRDGGDRHR